MYHPSMSVGHDRREVSHTPGGYEVAASCEACAKCTHSVRQRQGEGVALETLSTEDLRIAQFFTAGAERHGGHDAEDSPREVEIVVELVRRNGDEWLHGEVARLRSRKGSREIMGDFGNLASCMSLWSRSNVPDVGRVRQPPGRRTLSPMTDALLPPLEGGGLMNLEIAKLLKFTRKMVRQPPLRGEHWAFMRGPAGTSDTSTFNREIERQKEARRPDGEDEASGE